MQVKRRLPPGTFHPNGEPQEGEYLVIAGTHAFHGEILNVRRAGNVGEEARDAVLASSPSIPGPDRLGVDGPIDVVRNGFENRLSGASAERFIDPLRLGCRGDWSWTDALARWRCVGSVSLRGSRSRAAWLCSHAAQEQRQHRDRYSVGCDR
jgi:hypothetical protein